MVEWLSQNFLRRRLPMPATRSSFWDAANRPELFHSPKPSKSRGVQGTWCRPFVQRLFSIEIRVSMDCHERALKDRFSTDSGNTINFGDPCLEGRDTGWTLGVGGRHWLTFYNHERLHSSLD